MDRNFNGKYSAGIYIPRFVLCLEFISDENSCPTWGGFKTDHRQNMCRISRIDYIFFFFSSTNLYEFWLAQLFLSISSSPASFVSNYSLPSSSSHSSHHPPNLLLAFPSVLLHTVSICIWSWPLFRWSFFVHSPISPVVNSNKLHVEIYRLLKRKCSVN